VPQEREVCSNAEPIDSASPPSDEGQIIGRQSVISDDRKVVDAWQEKPIALVLRQQIAPRHDAPHQIRDDPQSVRLDLRGSVGMHKEFPCVRHLSDLALRVDGSRVAM
jgi:hypothetical protein